MSNYLDQCADLRQAAIADISMHIEKNGPTRIRNFGGVIGEPYEFDVFIDGDYLIIGSTAATIADLSAVCMIADAFNERI